MVISHCGFTQNEYYAWIILRYFSTILCEEFPFVSSRISYVRYVRRFLGNSYGIVPGTIIILSAAELVRRENWVIYIFCLISLALLYAKRKGERQLDYIAATIFSRFLAKYLLDARNFPRYKLPCYKSPRSDISSFCIAEQIEIQFLSPQSSSGTITI